MQSNRSSRSDARNVTTPRTPALPRTLAATATAVDTSVDDAGVGDGLQTLAQECLALPPASGFVSRVSSHPVAACVFCGWVNSIEAEECIACGRRGSAPTSVPPPRSDIDEPELLGMRLGDAVYWIDPNRPSSNGDR